MPLARSRRAPRAAVPSSRDAVRGGTRASILALLAAAAAGPAVLAADEPATFLARVETVVYDDEDAKHPVARSLTLFKDGVAWDFLETLTKTGEPTSGEPAEFVLHDPKRERIVLVDPARGVRTQIDSQRLERLRSSLAAWARKSDDPLMRWAGGPDFDTATGTEDDDDSLVLEGPRVRYEVSHEKATSPEVAEEYRRFADAALLLKALVHPGGLPPFPRLAINREIASLDAVPTSVRLRIEPRGGRLAGRPQVLRSEHRTLASWVGSDHKRVAAAAERIAVATPVDLAEYAATSAEPDDDRRRSLSAAK